MNFFRFWLLGFLASWLLGFLASWLLGFSASWLLGFSASRLLGFLASWLLGFSASWLLGFWASRLFGFLLVYAAFGGFLAFRILCIPSSSSAGGVFPTSCDLWVMLGMLVGHAVYFARTCCKIRHFTGPAEIELHPCLNHHFFEHPISRENAAKYDILGNLCSPCMSVCMHFFEHHRGSYPRQPSRCLVNSITPFLESLHPYLNHHFFRPHGGAAAPPQPPPPPPPLRLDFRQRFN